MLTLPAGWADYDVGPEGRVVAVGPVRETRPELRLITNSFLGIPCPHCTC